MEKVKFKYLFDFLKKSNLKASDEDESGEFPFYTSSNLVSKRTNKPIYDEVSLVIGNGGTANIHYADIPFATTSHCYIAVAKSQSVSTKYCYYFLHVNIQLLERGFKGAGLKNISSKYIENIEIPLPALETQNKIVAILDKAKTILDKREKTIALYDELLRATFLDMFGDPFVPKNNTFIPLSDVITGIDSGWSPVCEEKPRTTSKQVAILKQGSVSRRYFIPEANKILPSELPIKKAVYAQYKDLLFSRKNTPELVGSTAYLFEDYENLLLPDTIFNIRYDSSKISGVYLFYLFNNNEFKKKIQQLSVGQAESMSNVSQGRLLTLEVPFPNLATQLEFEKIVVKSYNSIFRNFKKAKVLIDRLLKSLSQQVFSDRIIIDVDAELEALINAIDLDKKEEENKIDSVGNDITFVQKLINKLDEQEFEEKEHYDKAKHNL